MLVTTSSTHREDEILDRLRVRSKLLQDMVRSIAIRSQGFQLQEGGTSAYWLTQPNPELDEAIEANRQERGRIWYFPLLDEYQRRKTETTKTGSRLETRDLFARLISSSTQDKPREIIPHLKHLDRITTSTLDPVAQTLEYSLRKAQGLPSPLFRSTLLLYGIAKSAVQSGDTGLASPLMSRLTQQFPWLTSGPVNQTSMISVPIPIAVETHYAALLAEAKWHEEFFSPDELKEFTYLPEVEEPGRDRPHASVESLRNLQRTHSSHDEAPVPRILEIEPDLRWEMASELWATGLDDVGPIVLSANKQADDPWSAPHRRPEGIQVSLQISEKQIGRIYPDGRTSHPELGEVERSWDILRARQEGGSGDDASTLYYKMRDLQLRALEYTFPGSRTPRLMIIDPARRGTYLIRESFPPLRLAQPFQR